MSWIIEHLAPQESSVYLLNQRSGIRRQISVPDLEDARMLDNLLIIKAKQFVWEVNPGDGHRRRLTMNDVAPAYLYLFNELPPTA